jgi:hypothetical protein
MWRYCYNAVALMSDKLFSHIQVEVGFYLTVLYYPTHPGVDGQSGSFQVCPAFPQYERTRPLVEPVYQKAVRGICNCKKRKRFY